MTPLERAARALCELNLRKVGRCRDETALLAAVGSYWPGHVPAVRAVLTAIREPSEAMVDAGLDVAIGVPAIWQAMIDAALAEEPT